MPDARRTATGSGRLARVAYYDLPGFGRREQQDPAPSAPQGDRGEVAASRRRVWVRERRPRRPDRCIRLARRRAGRPGRQQLVSARRPRRDRASGTRMAWGWVWPSRRASAWRPAWRSSPASGWATPRSRSAHPACRTARTAACGWAPGSAARYPSALASPCSSVWWVAACVALSSGVAVCECGVRVGGSVGGGLGVTLGRGVTVRVGVAVSLGPSVGRGVGVALGVRVAVGRAVAVSVAVAVAVAVRVAVFVGVAVGVLVGVAVRVGSGVAVSVGVRVGVSVGVAVPVADGVGVTDAVGLAVIDGVRVGVLVANSAIAVSSSVGETATVGVRGPSMFRPHPVSASMNKASTSTAAGWRDRLVISLLYRPWPQRRARGGQPPADRMRPSRHARPVPGAKLLPQPYCCDSQECARADRRSPR